MATKKFSHRLFIFFFRKNMAKSTGIQFGRPCIAMESGKLYRTDFEENFRDCSCWDTGKIDNAVRGYLLATRMIYYILKKISISNGKNQIEKALELELVFFYFFKYIYVNVCKNAGVRRTIRNNNNNNMYFMVILRRNDNII